MARHKSLPLFVQVAETIKGRILNDQYHKGEVIPPGRVLAEEFGVSDITIRKAIERLTQEGYLAPRQGYGTLVTDIKTEKVEIQVTGNFREWLNSVVGAKLRHETRVLDLAKTTPPGRVRELLGLEPDVETWRMKRVRILKNQPISYYLNYFCIESCRHIDKAEVAKRSLVEVFQETAHTQLTRFEQTVQATVADMEIADLLQTEFAAPLFFIENVYFSEENRPVMVTHMFYRGDSYVYKATIPLEGKGVGEW